MTLNQQEFTKETFESHLLDAIMLAGVVNLLEADSVGCLRLQGSCRGATGELHELRTGIGPHQHGKEEANLLGM